MSARFTRVGAYALCRDGDRVLLTHIGPDSDDPGKWTLPGGGLDFGESPEAGVLRELAEETGLMGRIISLAGVDSERGFVERPGGPVEYHALRVLYHVAVVGGELRDEVGGSSDTCAWFTFEEAEQLPLVSLAKVGIRLVRERG